jgi:hypothetical protein
MYLKYYTPDTTRKNTRKETGRISRLNNMRRNKLKQEKRLKDLS